MSTELSGINPSLTALMQVSPPTTTSNSSSNNSVVAAATATATATAASAKTHQVSQDLFPQVIRFIQLWNYLSLKDKVAFSKADRKLNSAKKQFDEEGYALEFNPFVLAFLKELRAKTEKLPDPRAIAWKEENKARNDQLIARMIAEGKDVSKIQRFLAEEGPEMKPCSLHIRYPTGWREETTQLALGAGGSKRALALAGSKYALLIPNLDVSFYKGLTSWTRVVNKEVNISIALSKLGFLTPQSIKVELALSADRKEGVLPAYLSIAFPSLATEGCFVVDKKGGDSPWKDFIFKEQEERFQEENWDSVLAPLINDILKVCLYDIHVSYDAQNIAIIRKKEVLETSKSPYEVRLFIYDMTDSCSQQIQVLSDAAKDCQVTSLNAKQLETFKIYLKIYIQEVFYSEFRNPKSGTCLYLDSPKMQLVEKLVERYSKRINLAQ